MSKEKNLVIMNKGVPTVEGEKHRKLAHIDCVSCLRITPLEITKHEGELDSVIVGPAINRLYEFEKLGMEPEEIESMMIDSKAANGHIHNLFEMLFDKCDEIEALEDELADCRARHAHELKIVKEHSRIDSSSIYGLVSPDTIEAQRNEIENLRAINKQLTEDLETAHTCLNTYNAQRSVITHSHVEEKERLLREIEGWKDVIKEDRKEIRRLKNKIERMICVTEEDE